MNANSPDASMKRRRDVVSQKSLETALFSFAILLRALVGFHPHSGQDNYEGSRVAYGGDFEAQRHWMELTWQLPIGEWYWYDLEYWGLDYPPLTAYVSYVCGLLSHVLVGPETVALFTSRGIEDPTHKTFMRATVLFLDLMVYGMAVWYSVDRSTDGRRQSSLWIFALAMAQPAILLIDHGHFQYNTVALGLSIAAFSYMVQPEFKNCLIGSVFFCLALNFKQMTLYYAPVVFCYLLGRCISEPKLFVLRFMALGLTVLIAFGLLWAPVIYYGPPNTTHLDRLLHVLRRIFPFQRGLFEGKVANLWCVLSTKPVRIRERLDPELQPLLALAVTLALTLPACVRMLRLGTETRTVGTNITFGDVTHRHWTLLLWANMSSALSFFLASFQVHEKSILLALAPCALLLWQDPVMVDWFSMICCWTLWPLLQTDRLQVPYVCCILIFEAMIRLRKSTTGQTISIFRAVPWRWIPALSYVGMIALHVVQLAIPPPSHLPDIYEVLWSAAGCGMFCVSWFITCIKLHSGQQNSAVVKEKAN